MILCKRSGTFVYFDQDLLIKDEIVLYKLDCYTTFYSGLLVGTLTALEGGNVMTQFQKAQFLLSVSFVYIS